MKKYGVLGYPLSHSLSPPMHNAGFQALSIAAEYKKYQILPDKFDSSIKNLRDENIDGFNITIPYKGRILDYLDDIDKDAEAIGAVNTVLKTGSNWKGYNTDIAGFIAPLLKVKQKISSCLLLGTGGAGRAVIYSIGKYLKPDQIVVAGRSKEKFEDILLKLQPLVNPATLNFLEFEHAVEGSRKYDLIVNATPLGTYPGIDKTPLPGLKDLKTNAIVYDLVYNPELTKLLDDAQKISDNIIILNGLEMLIEQAAHSFKIWTGKEMPRDVVRESLKAALRLKSEE